MLRFQKQNNEDNLKRIENAKGELERLQHINKEQGERFTGQIKTRAERYDNDYQQLRQEKQSYKDDL